MSRPALAAFFSRFQHIVVLVSYALIAMVTSVPLIANFADHIPGVDGDVWSYLWALGWARVSLLDLGTNPFHTDYIFYPLGGATQLLWGTALPSFASIPLQLAFGLVPAFNLVYLAASVLTAYGTYLLALEILTPRAPRETPWSSPRPAVLHLASWFAGLVFAFGALRMGYGIAFTNLFHTEFIPFYVLFLLRVTGRGGWKNPILAGIFFAFNAYIDFQLAAFLALLTTLWLLWAFARDPGGLVRGRSPSDKSAENLWGLGNRASSAQRAENLSGLVPRYLVLLALAAVLSLPMLIFVLQDFSIEGGDYIRVYPLKYSAERSYDLLSYVVPNARSTFYQPFAPRVQGVNASVNTPDDSEQSPDRQSFLGITALALAVLGAIRFRRVLGFWILTVIVFALLSFGPVLHVAGSATEIPLPFVLVNNIPILNHIRIPMRYGVIVFFGVALLSGAGAMIVLAARRWLLVPLGMFVLLESAIFPYPTLAFNVPPVYGQIAHELGDFALLEIPSFNWRFAAKNEIYQVVHQKRILRAYTNRIAPDLADYFSLRATPIVVKTMRILEGGEPNESIEDRVAPDRAGLFATLRFYNLRYAVVHLDQLNPDRAAQIDRYLRDVLQASVFYHDDAITGYRFLVPPPAAPAGVIDLAQDANLMYLGRGWEIEPLAERDGVQARSVKGKSSEMYFGENVGPAGTLELRVLNQDDPATMQVSWNGQPGRVLPLQPGWNTLSIRIEQDDNHPWRTLLLTHTDTPNTIAVASMVLK